jgi:hypothetical protein
VGDEMEREVEIHVRLSRCGKAALRRRFGWREFGEGNKRLRDQGVNKAGRMGIPLERKVCKTVCVRSNNLKGKAARNRTWSARKIGWVGDTLTLKKVQCSSPPRSFDIGPPCRLSLEFNSLGQQAVQGLRVEPKQNPVLDASFENRHLVFFLSTFFHSLSLRGKTPFLQLGLRRNTSVVLF